MPKNSTGQGPGARGQLVRIVLGVLLAFNLVAAGLVLYPAGGSAADLERQLASLQSQVAQQRALLERTREHAASVEKGRAEGDTFLGDYFLERRTAYATLLGELDTAARDSQFKPKDHAYNTELIDGSDSLSMMTITASFEGTYKQLMNFVHEMDRSPRLLIIEALYAAPQQGSNTLSVNMKIDAFVREGSAR